MTSQKPATGLDFFQPSTWQALIGVKGYRLYAVGNGAALTAERLPEPSDPRLLGVRPAAEQSTAQDTQTAQRHQVLVTWVSSPSCAAQPAAHGARSSQQACPTSWQAVRSVQTLAELKSYLDQHGKTFIVFFTRTLPKNHGSSANGCAPPVASPEWIGRGLGLAEEDLEALCVLGRIRELEAWGLGDHPAVESAARGSEPGRCMFPECAEPPRVPLLNEVYCVSHYITACYEKLDDCSQLIIRRPLTEELAEQLRAFLSACMEQSASLTRPADLSNLVRARLTDIRYMASELRRRLRRGPRIAESRPVRLLCETPGRAWSEETRTVQISRQGAMFTCEHLARAEDRLFLERPDTGCRARIRMVWRRPEKLGRFAMGVELLNSDNFWGANWTAWEDPAPSQALSRRLPQPVSPTGLDPAAADPDKPNSIR